MMIKQRKHTIRIEKKSSASVNVEDYPTCTRKLHIDDKPEEKAIAAQSTPKRGDSYGSKSQDGSDSPDYRGFSLTQDENIEVTWDWHSSLRKDNNDSKKSNELSTPKRAAIRQRKRPSSSPLMYKPVRKLLIKKESTDGIEQFKAEMLALTKQLQSGHKHTNNTDNSSNNSNNYNNGHSSNNSDNSNGKVDENIDVPLDIKFDNFNDQSDVIVILDDDESPKKSEPIINQVPEVERSIDDLFNDSMDEVIIRFSQETEEKLKISPADSKTNGAIAKAQKESSQSSNYLLKSERKRHNNDVSKEIKKDTKYTTQYNKTSSMPNKKLPNVSLSTLRQQISCSKTDDLNLFIPDDSFDDFVATCEADLSKNDVSYSATSSSVQRHSNLQKPVAMKTEFVPKVPKLPSTSTLSKLTGNISKSSNNNVNPSMRNTSNVNALPKNTSNFNSLTKNSSYANSSARNVASNANSLAKNATSAVNNFSARPTQTQVPTKPQTPQTYKFFKSKSHSDSNFNSNESKAGANSKPDTSTRNNLRTASSSSLKSDSSSSNLGSKGGSRAYGGKVVSNGQQVQRWTSYLDSNVPKQINVQKDNIMYNVNRCRVKGDGDCRQNGKQRQPTGLTSEMQSMQLQCTPEEIERKRLEAVEKLKARRKQRTQINDSPDSSGISSGQSMTIER